MRYFKAIKFTSFIIFTEDTTDEELKKLEDSSIQFIYGTDQDKHIKFIDNKFFFIRMDQLYSSRH